MFRDESRKPDFENLRLILEKKPAPRPVLFEFILSADKEKYLVGADYKTDTEFDRVVTTIKAFDSGGYDFAPIIVRGMEFARKEQKEGATISLNEGALITDRKSFESYPWPDEANADFSIISRPESTCQKKRNSLLFPTTDFGKHNRNRRLRKLCYMVYDNPELQRLFPKSRS